MSKHVNTETELPINDHLGEKNVLMKWWHHEAATSPAPPLVTAIIETGFLFTSTTVFGEIAWEWMMMMPSFTINSLTYLHATCRGQHELKELV